MLGLKSLNDDERKLVLAGWFPGFPDHRLEVPSPRDMQLLLDAKWEASAPLASYVLNRTAAWLEDGPPFAGDREFMSTWTGEGDTRACTLTRKTDGAAWKISWDLARYRKVKTPEMTLSRGTGGGGWEVLATGEITTGEPGSGNRQGFSNCPEPVAGTVEAEIHYGGFPFLVEFAQAVYGSMPKGHFDTLENTVTFYHQLRLEGLGDLIRADGGLPGKLCAARDELVTIIVAGMGADWARTGYKDLAEGLRQAGAVWGQGVMVYNDLDYSCCVIETPDGVALFNDNAATLADERAYVSRFVEEDGRTKHVLVYVFKEDESYPAKVEGIMDGTAEPDFSFDFDTRLPRFAPGRTGVGGMTMFFWQFLSDRMFAISDGNLNSKDRYWATPVSAETPSGP